MKEKETDKSAGIIAILVLPVMFVLWALTWDTDEHQEPSVLDSPEFFQEMYELGGGQIKE